MSPIRDPFPHFFCSGGYAKHPSVVWCSILLFAPSGAQQEGESLKYENEFELLSEVITSIQTREVAKGVILPDAFEEGGLDDFERR